MPDVQIAKVDIDKVNYNFLYTIFYLRHFIMAVIKENKKRNVSPFH